jgi:hypothetical protein
MSGGLGGTTMTRQSAMPFLVRAGRRRGAAAADGDASPAVQYRATYAALIRFTQIAVSFSAFPG